MMFFIFVIKVYMMLKSNIIESSFILKKVISAAPLGLKCGTQKSVYLDEMRMLTMERFVLISEMSDHMGCKWSYPMRN
jgi:hypothetical protein